MSKFTYGTRIGDYNDAVQVEVSLKSDVGISQEDYAEVKQALEVIEAVFSKYHKNWSEESMVKVKENSR